MRDDDQVTVGRVVRTLFGTATVTLLIAAFAVGGSARVFAAAAACGTIWWTWDVLAVHVFGPMGEWIMETIMGGGVGASDGSTRPTLDEVVAMLERHLERATSRKVDINAAVRLEEIYRTVKKDPAAARRVVNLVRERYPDAPELARFSTAEEVHAPDPDAGPPVSRGID